MLQLEAIRAASIFQSGMVLQRRTPICIWGQASGAGAVRVTLEQDTAPPWKAEPGGLICRLERLRWG